MKITALETIRLEEFANLLWLRVHTDEGLVGLGETFDEVVALMHDLRSVSCDIMTIGQYLQPHARRLPVERYVTPEEFAKWREVGMTLGFHHVESSPLTRSSYHAREQASKEI